jgi:hypothetical protein
MTVGSDLERHWRASCSRTRLVNTPLQVNLAPSVIKSSRAFSPSRLMWVTFRRSITSARPQSWEWAEFHVLRSSAVHGATNLPSITSLNRRWPSTTEIFIINRHPTSEKQQYRCQSADALSSPIRGDVKKKNFSLRSTETWMLSLASSPASVLEGVRSWSFWVRRVLQRDQPS